MGYVALLEESPELFLLVLAISLVVTLFVYGIFPIVFAKARKTPITKKKYTRLCYGINFIGIILFIAFDGGASGGPYLLWTWIFSGRGLKILEEKGLLSEGAPAEKEIPKAVENANKIFFCRKCGTKLDNDARFCRKCGTEIKEEQQ